MAHLFELIKQIHNWLGLFLLVSLMLCIPAVGLLHLFRPVVIRNVDLFSRDRATPHPYTPPPHVHQLDIERSSVTTTDTGAVFARCCIQGCHEGVFIGANMASSLWKELR